MKLRLAILAAALVGLGVPAAALAGGDPPAEECVPIPYHPCPGDHGAPPPGPHGGPTCENGGTVVWINQWHYVCVLPPDDECNYFERRIRWL